MLGKRENVMCSKIAAFVTPALLAGEVVPEEDGVVLCHVCKRSGVLPLPFFHE
jgi:hypothetical protein